MSLRFNGQVAMIFGAARGIGEAIAMRLSKEGAKVIIIDVRENEINAVKHKIIKNGGALEAYCVDISDEKKVNQCIKQVVKFNTKIDILINSVGITGPTNCQIEKYELKDF